MNTRVKHEIIQLCEASPAEEKCGFILHDGSTARFIECRNSSPTPAQSFQIEPGDYVAAKMQGHLLGVWHSHPVDAAFSEADLHYAQATALPSYLYNLPAKTWHEYIPPTYRPPLEGQPFVMGFFDCFGLVRNYYRQQLGIHINDYDRDESFIDLPSISILDHYMDEGGYRAVGTATLRKHDVLVFNVGRIMPQHFGVFVGNSRVMHHVYKGLSRTDLFNSAWQRRIKVILRHKSNP